MSYYARRALLLMTPSHSSQRKKRSNSIAIHEPRQQEEQAHHHRDNKEQEDPITIGRSNHERPHRDSNPIPNRIFRKDNELSQSFSQRHNHSNSLSQQQQRFLSWDDSHSYSKYNHNMDNNINPSQHTVHTVTTHTSNCTSTHPHGTTTSTHNTNSNDIVGHSSKNKKRSWIAAALSVMQSPNKKSKGKDSTNTNDRMTADAASHSMSSNGLYGSQDSFNGAKRALKDVHGQEKWRQEIDTLRSTVQTTVESLEQLRQESHETNQLLQQQQKNEHMIQDRIQIAMRDQEKQLTQAYNRELQTVSLRIQNKLMLELEQTKQLLVQSNIQVQELQTKYDALAQKYISSSDISQMIQNQIHHYLNSAGGARVIDTIVHGAVSSMISNLESRVIQRLLSELPINNLMCDKENLNFQHHTFQLQQNFKYSGQGTKNQVTPNPKIIQNNVENAIVCSKSVPVMTPGIQNGETSDTLRINHPKLHDDKQVSNPSSSSSISSNDSTYYLKEGEKRMIVDRLPGQFQTDEGNLSYCQSKEMNGTSTKLDTKVKKTVCNKHETFPRVSSDHISRKHAGLSQNVDQKNVVDVLNSMNPESRENSVPKRRSSRLAKSSQTPILDTTYPTTSVAPVTTSRKSVTVPVTLSRRKETASKSAEQKSRRMNKNEDDYHTPVTLGRKQISVPKTNRSCRKKKRSKDSFPGVDVAMSSLNDIKIDDDNDHKQKNNDPFRNSSSGKYNLDSERDKDGLFLKSPPLMNNPHATIKNGLLKKKRRARKVSSRVEASPFFSSEKILGTLPQFDENRYIPRRKLIDPRFGESSKDIGVFDFED